MPARELNVVPERLAIVADVNDEIPRVMGNGLDDPAFAQHDVQAVGTLIADDRLVHGLKLIQSERVVLQRGILARFP